MNTNICTRVKTTNIEQTVLYDSEQLIYIDLGTTIKQYKIVKFNYVKYYLLTYEEVIIYLQHFHQLFLKTFNFVETIPKIIVVIDVHVLKKTIGINTSSMYNINLINLIKYTNTTFNENIYKCLVTNCNEFERGVIVLFKNIFKHIEFVNKVIIDSDIL